MAERIATVRPVEESEATGKVAEIYADIKKTRSVDRISNFWRVLATNPDQLELIWNHLKAIMHPEAVGRASKLSPLMREIIAVAVSTTNGCAYCTNSHTAAAKTHGMDEEMLGEVLAVVSLFNLTNRLADGYRIEPDVLPPVD